jgi:hypothetical protein
VCEEISLADVFLVIKNPADSATAMVASSNTKRPQNIRWFQPVVGTNQEAMVEDDKIMTVDNQH